VLLNLYVNAWQAMPDGGDLYISTENVTLTNGHILGSEAMEGRYVKMSVTDTGIGMDEETQKKIFDPFFTTKEIERGTGLGLASAYGIVQNHNGMITVRSRPGAGATLEILLPASDKAPVQDQESAGAFARGSEGILLVDDEDDILHVTKQLLEALDYQVFTARDGKSALETYRANRDRIHMVVLDMIMPGMGGGTTFQELKKLDPHVKVLLCSGYSEDSQAKEILSQGCNGFIQKPFNLTELSQQVRSILDTPS
jgi:CheY-like chemotaxis protein